MNPKPTHSQQVHRRTVGSGRRRRRRHGQRHLVVVMLGCFAASACVVGAAEPRNPFTVSNGDGILPVGCDCCPPPCVTRSPYYIQPRPVTGDGGFVVPEASILPNGEGTTGSPYEFPEGVEGVPPDTLAGMNNASASQMPGGLGAVAASQSPSMHMIGDFFGGGYFLGGMDGFATVPGAGGDRRFKATDNLNPMPQDRLFFNYQRFNEVVYDINGTNQSVNRYTFGIERTFLDDTMSLELRLPIVGGLNNVQSFNDPDTTTSEFGNVSLTVKAYVCPIGCWSVLSGMAIILPTASDAAVDGVSTRTLLENNAVHLQPYIGLNYSQKCSRWFSTAYMAFDFDTNGNALYTSDDGGSGTSPMTFVDDVRDQTLMFVDCQLGYWLYQDYGHIGYLNGIAPVLELHYSRALNDPYQDAPELINNPFGKIEVLNLTGGLVFDIRNSATVTIYGTTPLNKEEVEFQGLVVSPNFESEFGVQCVYRY